MRLEELHKMPLYAKAEELRNLVETIVSIVEKSDITYRHDVSPEWIKHNLEAMSSNSLLIPMKIAGAFHEDTPYDLKMENAALIRKAAREILTDAMGIQLNGYKDGDYLDLLRKEVDEFRVLFAQWVASFDIWNYDIDRWGLFNPPGVNYDDMDPDENLPPNHDFLDESDDGDETPNPMGDEDEDY